MEPPPKRTRLTPAENSSASGPDADVEFYEQRTQNDLRLKSTFEAIFEKYGKDFTGIGDEVDLETGEIVVDNGHLSEMRDEQDVGEDAVEEEDVGRFLRALTEVPGLAFSDSDAEMDTPDQDAPSEERALQMNRDKPAEVNGKSGEVRLNFTPGRSSKQNLPSDMAILEQFGKELGPHIVQYVSQLRPINSSAVEPAWQTPGQLPPIAKSRPIIRSVIQPKSVRPLSLGASGSIWAPLPDRPDRPDRPSRRKSAGPKSRVRQQIGPIIISDDDDDDDGEEEIEDSGYHSPHGQGQPLRRESRLRVSLLPSLRGRGGDPHFMEKDKPLDSEQAPSRRTGNDRSLATPQTPVPRRRENLPNQPAIVPGKTSLRSLWDALNNDNGSLSIQNYPVVHRQQNLSGKQSLRSRWDTLFAKGSAPSAKDPTPSAKGHPPSAKGPALSAKGPAPSAEDPALTRNYRPGYLSTRNGISLRRLQSFADHPRHSLKERVKPLADKNPQQPHMITTRAKAKDTSRECNTTGEKSKDLSRESGNQSQHVAGCQHQLAVTIPFREQSVEYDSDGLPASSPHKVLETIEGDEELLGVGWSRQEEEDSDYDDNGGPFNSDRNEPVPTEKASQNPDVRLDITSVKSTKPDIPSSSAIIDRFGKDIGPQVLQDIKNLLPSEDELTPLEFSRSLINGRPIPGDKTLINMVDDGTRPKYSNRLLCGTALLLNPSRPLSIAEIRAWYMRTYSFYDKHTGWEPGVHSALKPYNGFYHVRDPSLGNKGKGWAIRPGFEETFLVGHFQQSNLPQHLFEPLPLRSEQDRSYTREAKKPRGGRVKEEEDVPTPSPAPRALTENNNRPTRRTDSGIRESPVGTRDARNRDNEDLPQPARDVPSRAEDGDKVGDQAPDEMQIDIQTPGGAPVNIEGPTGTVRSSPPDLAGLAWDVCHDGPQSKKTIETEDVQPNDGPNSQTADGTDGASSVAGVELPGEENIPNPPEFSHGASSTPENKDGTGQTAPTAIMRLEIEDPSGTTGEQNQQPQQTPPAPRQSDSLPAIASSSPTATAPDTQDPADTNTTSPENPKKRARGALRFSRDRLLREIQVGGRNLVDIAEEAANGAASRLRRTTRQTEHPVQEGTAEEEEGEEEDVTDGRRKRRFSQMVEGAKDGAEHGGKGEVAGISGGRFSLRSRPRAI